MAEDQLKVAILIVSDTAASDPTTDKCIPVLKEVFADNWRVIDTAIVPDDRNNIQQFVEKWSSAFDFFANLIVTSGGTGFSIKDNTPEV